MVDSPDMRTASPHDFERIMELERACFEGDLAYSRRQLHYLVFAANSTTLVEGFKGVIRGFVIVLYRAGSSVAGIETVNVDPVFRKLGVGSRLLAAAEEDIRRKGARTIRLEVSITNHAAISLYERAGFHRIGVLKNYYHFLHDSSRDAVRMVKELG
jgi:ribosomal protein S18 acetylase RimI-like enzyme